MEVLEERETAILGEEVHEIPGDGVHAVKDACPGAALAEAAEAAVAKNCVLIDFFNICKKRVD